MIDGIYLFGDLICPEKDKLYFDEAHREDLLGKDLCDIIFNENHFSIINLEGPITASKKEQPKGGSPNLKSEPVITGFLSQIPHLLISGANNHITDYGIEGLEDTKKYLDEISVPYIGFGTSPGELYNFYDIELGGKVIRTVSFAQNEFCTMECESQGFGAAPYDPLTVFDLIREYKNAVDYVVVLFHGGKENYQYPTPMQRKICRKMIAVGADLVLCQHSHCVGCKEESDCGTTVYGTGNMIFNIAQNELWNTSVAIRLAIENEKLKIDYIPLVKSGAGVRLADSAQAEEILSAFNNRSNEISVDGFTEKHWADYCEKNSYAILWNAFFRFPKVIYWLDRLSGKRITARLLSERKKNLTVYNYIRCEAINEMCQTIFYVNEKKLNNNQKDE